MKKGWKIVALVLCIAMAAMLLVACSNDGAKVSAIKNAGKLVIGTSPDYAPFEFKTMKDGKPQVVGMDIDLANEVAKELGVPLEIKELEFDSILMALSSDQVDLGISCFNPDPERANAVNFSDIYFTEDFGLIVRATDKDALSTREAFDGKTIGVQRGTTMEKLVNEKYTNSTIKSLTSVNDLVLDLKAGKIDAIMAEKSVTAVRAAKDAELALSDYVEPAPEDTVGIAVTIKKGNDDLTEVVNKVIKRMQDDGSLEKAFNDAVALSKDEVEAVE